MRHNSRTPACLAALGAVVAVCAAVGTVSAGGAGGPLRDGNWSGTMAVGASIDFSQEGIGLIASGKGSGVFNLTLTGGVASGDYLLAGTSEAALESTGVSGQGEAVATVTGEMQGISTGPILAPMAAHLSITGTVNSSGLVVPFDVSFDAGPGEMLSSTLVITASSCSIASGTWAQEFRAAVEGAGGTVTSFNGSWAATFTGTNPGEADEVLATMLAQGEAILADWYESGTFDAPALEEVLIAAEHFAVSGPTNDACGSASAGAWASPLAGMVQRLLVAIANSPSTTPEIMMFGIAAGLRTNTLPSAPPETLEATLHTKAGELLNAAIAGNDQAGITFIGIAASSMGWTDLSSASTDALGG